MSHVIRFADGVLIEVAENPNPAAPVSGGAAERLSAAFQSSADLIGSVLRVVVSATSRALRDSGAAEAEVEFNIGFSIEGNIYVTKATGEGNIAVRVKVNGASS
jgi:hypothetical protein